MKVFFSAVLLLVFASIPGVVESAAIMGVRSIRAISPSMRRR